MLGAGSKMANEADTVSALELLLIGQKFKKSNFKVKERSKQASGTEGNRGNPLQIRLSQKSSLR